jgi:multidrug efflux system membrane fusion protein
MSLATETGFPHKGTINFINNQVDSLTGTITVRGVFPNPKDPKTGIRLMSPGMFVRIHLPVSKPYKALLVAQKVVQTDQGLKNLFIIDENDKIQYRRVDPGAVQPDSLQVILKGTEPKDRVALTNLQFIRPDMKVAPEEVPMPTLPVNGKLPRNDKPAPAKANGKQ